MDQMVTKAEKERLSDKIVQGPTLEYYSESELTLSRISELFEDFKKKSKEDGFTLSKEPWINIYHYYDDTEISIQCHRFETDVEYEDRQEIYLRRDKNKKKVANQRKEADYQLYLKLKKRYE